MSRSNVVVMSDDSDSSDYDSKNVTRHRLEDDFQMRSNHRHHSPESTSEQISTQLPSSKPKRTYRKKTIKEKEETTERRQRKRSEKSVSEKTETTTAVLLDPVPRYAESLPEENNRTIRELLSKIHIYEEVLSELGKDPIQLWITRRK
jgi:hypothetical protein